jgi:AraC family transcriptional regulator, positive regulator of tynA and feaB
MSQSFSTDLVPIPDRLEAWRWNAQQICGDCRFQFPKRLSFHGSIERRKVAGLELTLFSSSPLSFNKYPVVSPHSEDRSCIVITQLAGARRYCQDGKVASLKGGDTTLIDSGRPWSSECLSDCARLYLRLPYSLMEARLRCNPFPIALQISGASGLGAILSCLLVSLYHQAEELTPEEGTAAVESYLRILSAYLGNPEFNPAGANCSDVLAERIAMYVETHLAEATLGPAEIASAIGISVRHLHRIFSRRGCTVAEWIRNERLRRCHDALCDARLRDKSITDIAFYWGFNDSAHFSHSFKKQFGICPRAFRAGLWSKSLTPEPLARDGHDIRRPDLKVLRPS